MAKINLEILLKPIREALPRLSQKTMNRLDDNNVLFMFQLLSMEPREFRRMPFVGEVVISDIISNLGAIEQQDFYMGEFKNYGFPKRLQNPSGETLRELMLTFRERYPVKPARKSGKSFSDISEKDRVKWLNDILPEIDLSQAKSVIGEITSGAEILFDDLEKRQARNLATKFNSPRLETELSSIELDTMRRVRAGAIAATISKPPEIKLSTIELKRAFIDQVSEILKTLPDNMSFDEARATATMALEGRHIES